MNPIRPFLLLSTLCVLLAPSGWAQEIETKEVKFQSGTVESHAYLAVPKKEGKYPAILVLHEMWGHNDFMRGQAEKLAKLGYVALAVDLFGEGRKGHTPQGGGALVARIKGNADELNKRFLAAMKFAQLQDKSDREKIAAIGYGFGADVCLQMARNGIKGLDGVATFHPLFRNIRPPNPPIQNLPAKILILEASNDPFVFVVPKAYQDFHAMMKKLQVDMKTIKFENAIQGFAVPGSTARGKKLGMPLRFDAAEEAIAWKAATKFLKEIWNPQPAPAPAPAPVE